MKITVTYKRPFQYFVKKQGKPFKAAIEDQVKLISACPDLGEAKTGDLSGIYVYKFKFNRQEYLIAYRFVEHEEDASDEMLDCNRVLKIDFYQIGSHEKFYEDLKLYLRSNR